MTSTSLAMSQAPFSSTIVDQAEVMIDAVAHDWFRWPAIAARVKELKREKRRQELTRKISK